MRTALALLATTVALVAAACGGSAEKTSGGAAVSGVASAAPASAALFLELNADLESAQWQEVKGLADDIRAGKGLFKDLYDQAAEGADWAAVDAAFGPVLAIVALEDGETVVVLTQPDDVEQLKTLLGEKGTPAVAREVGGWTAVAQKEADLDAYEAALGKGTLADDEAFAEAVGGLPEDVLVRVYAGGPGLGKALSSAAGDAGAGEGAAGDGLGGLGLDPSALTGLTGTGGLKSLVVAVEAAGGALEVTGALEGDKDAGEPYTPAFLERIPAGVIAAADWHGAASLLSDLRSDPDLGESIGQLETALGVTLDQLEPLVAGEGALYVRPGIALPEITVALEVADEAGALATLDGIVQRLAGLAEGKTSETTVDGVTAKVLDLGLFKLTYAAVDGTLIATTGATGIADFRSTTGDKLADDPGFAAAAEQAGLGETTSGFVYADVPKVVQLLNGLGGALGGLLGGDAASTGGDQLVPTEGIERFGTLFGHATADGTTVRFTVVLTITSA